MIDKIHFSVNIIIYFINAIICILYYNIKGIDLTGYNLSPEYITQKETIDNISLAYSIFLLIYCLIYVVIYQEIYGKDLLKDLFINFIYILLSSNMIYINYKTFAEIKSEEINFSKILYNIPNYPLETSRTFLMFIQGLFALLVLFVLIKEIISYYRGLKSFILFYFQNGGRIFYFELRHLII